jgi:hypothetical protein
MIILLSSFGFYNRTYSVSAFATAHIQAKRRHAVQSIFTLLYAFMAVFTEALVANQPAIVQFE